MLAKTTFPIAICFGCSLFAMQLGAAGGGTTPVVPQTLQLHVVFNNVPYRKGLVTGWGFSCLVEGLDQTLLFDTGSDGDVLLANLERLGFDPTVIAAVVLSHDHSDHTGGLQALLARHSDLTVYVPDSFPASFRKEVRRLGGRTETVSGPRRLMERVYSTGEMGVTTPEQGLVLDTPQGLVLLTGCAHPNVADMVERATETLAKPVHLLVGGFHLAGRSEAEIETIIARLRALGVVRVAPSHCTGDRAIRLFREVWGSDFVEGGLGARIQVPDS